MEWKYKISLVNPHIFAEIEKNRGIKIPEDLKYFISEVNAATPSKYTFMVGTTERVFGAVLSFNRGDPDSVFPILDSIKDKNLMPFGIDPFGNFICYALKEQKIVFLDHETDIAYSTENNLNQFLEHLY